MYDVGHGTRGSVQAIGPSRFRRYDVYVRELFFEAREFGKMHLISVFVEQQLI